MDTGAFMSQKYIGESQIYMYREGMEVKSPFVNGLGKITSYHPCCSDIEPPSSKTSGSGRLGRS
jgi:hypothetical protein